MAGERKANHWLAISMIRKSGNHEKVRLAPQAAAMASRLFPGRSCGDKSIGRSERSERPEARRFKRSKRPASNDCSARASVDALLRRSGAGRPEQDRARDEPFRDQQERIVELPEQLDHEKFRRETRPGGIPDCRRVPPVPASERRHYACERRKSSHEPSWSGPPKHRLNRSA